MKTSKKYYIIYYKVKEGEKNMKVLKSAGGPHEVLYVCEGCGCVTDQIEDIFEFNGIEMCEECVDTYEFIDTTDCGIVAVPK